MRDLKADLNYVTVPVGIMKIKELYAIAEHALNRAINAEAENAKLSKVVDAAKDLPCPIWEHSNPVEDKLWDTFITALTELDKAKEGQDG